ncbi:MAG: extracellular solute-binding protein [Armatimonadota bacterium]
MKTIMAAVAVALALGATMPARSQSASIVVYSARREPLILPVIDRFRQQTGLRVTIWTGSSGELSYLLHEERSKPRADVIISNEVSILEVMRRQGALEPYLEPAVAVRRLPAESRALDGSWIGLSARALVLLASRDRLAWNKLSPPASMLDLVDERWQGRIVMPVFTNEEIIVWLSALRLLRGDQWTALFFQRLRSNRPMLVAGGTEVREAIARGEAAVGIANHYDYHQRAAEGSRNISIIYPDQGSDGMGVLFLPTGIGVVHGGPNPRGARRLVDFLTGDPKAQELYAKANFEYPLLPGVPLHPEVRPLNQFARMAVTYQQLGDVRESTLRLIRDGFFR